MLRTAAAAAAYSAAMCVLAAAGGIDGLAGPVLFLAAVAAGCLVAAVSSGALRWSRVEGPGRVVSGDGSMGWHLGIVVLAVIVMLAAQTAAVVVAALIEQGPAEVDPAELSTVGLLAAVGTGWVGMTVAAVATAVLLPGGLLRRWGLGGGLWRGRRSIGRGAAAGLLTLLLAGPVVIATLALTQYLITLAGGDASEQHPVLADMPDGGAGLLLTFIVAGVVIPFGEELLFRGLLQTGLLAVLHHVVSPPRRDYATHAEADGHLHYVTAWPPAGPPSARLRWTAIVLTSALFAVIHPDFSIAAIFVLSLAFGYVYERTGNLWAPIVAHAGFNLFNLAVQTLVGTDAAAG